MVLNIKNKIRWGVSFLFVLLLLSGVVSVYNLKKLQGDTANILSANYESLTYCHTLQQLAGRIGTDTVVAATFATVLQQQLHNVTEPGEAQATHALQQAFVQARQGGGPGATDRVQQQLQRILELNMRAIERKNRQAGHTAEKAFTTLLVLFSLTFIIGLTFLVNFPAVVTVPIRKLMEATRQIGQKNYTYRVHLESRDEFGQLADSFNNMAERIEAFESSNLNRLLFEKARAEAVINSLKDASIGIDSTETILFANRQALHLLGLPPGSLAGRKAADVAAGNDLFRYLLYNDSTAPFTIVTEGKEHYFTRELVTVNNEGTDNRVIVVKNITSFKELDQAKTHFIATVSHELKTPLASSDFSLKLLEDARIGPLTPEQQDLVRQLKQDNARMLKILSELLNMTQIESGKIQLQVEPVQVQELIAASLQQVSQALREKQVQVVQELDNLPVIRGDGDKIGWVLNNYLTNAIRYAPAGSTITVKAWMEQGRLSVSVRDEGPGIAPQYREKVFDRYFQVPGRKDGAGSGIGLAICREIMTAMGGTVWVKSQAGAGSAFGFTIEAESLQQKA